MGDGLKWATCNMGAYNPWEYGDYYAWGATVPFYLTEFSLWIDGKTGYNRFNYPFMHEGYINDEGITKYTIDDGLKALFGMTATATSSATTKPRLPITVMPMTQQGNGGAAPGASPRRMSGRRCATPTSILGFGQRIIWVLGRTVCS